MSEGKPTIDLGSQYQCIGLGYGDSMMAQIAGFEENAVGIVFRQLPEELVLLGRPSGTRFTPEESAMVASRVDLPTLLILAADPNSLRNLGQHALSLADEWERYLTVDTPEDLS